MFLVGDFSLETHVFNIKDYSSSDDWAVLIGNIANHYNQDFWLIKDIFDICLNYNVDPKLNRYNKRENIILGVRFINKLLGLFEGNIENSLRYYNAGHDYIKKGETYAKNIQREYRMLNLLYVRNQISYGKIYRKETF